MHQLLIAILYKFNRSATMYIPVMFVVRQPDKFRTLLLQAVPAELLLHRVSVESMNILSG